MSTVGPSEESLESVTMIGKAAHICGAAPGPGSRRYVPSMTPQERASISNAIWLCANHADLIDRDEIAYSIERLHAMKSEHEAWCAKILRTGSSHELGAGLLAIGPEVVCIGDIKNISTISWTLRIKHFVIGDVHAIVAFISNFDEVAEQNRYLLSNELGDGRILSSAPSLRKEKDGYTLLCPIESSFPRTDVQNLGSAFALQPETNDWYVDKNTGSLARVSGLDYLPQKIRSTLSVQQGEDVFHPEFGMRFFEYFQEYGGSPWLTWLLTLDVVRQASIPFADLILGKRYTPLQCVTRVRNFELRSDAPKNNRIDTRVDFDVQGVGRWQHDLSIYVPTKEQMDERARIVALRSPMFAIRGK